MNMGQAKAAVEAANKRMQDANVRRNQQLVTVRDYERQLAEVTSTSTVEDVAALNNALAAAKSILAACDREIADARTAREQADRELQNVKLRIAEYANKIAVLEGNTRSNNRYLADLEHRIKVLTAAIGSDRREMELLKTAREALLVDAVPA